MSGRLVSALQNEDIFFVVHIDAKADLRSFESAARTIANVHFIEGRSALNYGCFSLVAVTLKLIEAAVALGRFQRLTLISGISYPVLPKNDVRSVLSSGEQYIGCRRVAPDRPFYDCVLRYYLADDALLGGRAPDPHQRENWDRLRKYVGPFLGGFTQSASTGL